MGKGRGRETGVSRGGGSGGVATSAHAPSLDGALDTRRGEVPDLVEEKEICGCTEREV